MKILQRSLLSALLFSAVFASVPTIPSLPAIAQTRQVQPLSITRMGIGQIKLGSKGVQVQRILGKPQQARTEQTNCCGTLYHWKYPELEVRFEDFDSTGDLKQFSVYQISTKSTKYATFDGIRVGDRRSKVLQVYRNARVTQEQDGLYYTNDEYASGLVFKFKNDRVVEIITNTLLN